MNGQPGDKSPGYYRVSLRDEMKTGYQMSKLQSKAGTLYLCQKAWRDAWLTRLLTPEEVENDDEDDWGKATRESRTSERS
jgi:hypothetical protein